MEHNRRTVLRTAIGLTAASYSKILGANDRVRVAGLGVGGRCRFLLGKTTEQNVQIDALCDVYQPNLEKARELVAPAAKFYLDYHDVLGRSDIDAVFIGSPDHWHIPMTLDAIRAGKDVYVEKPVSHTIEEGDQLLKAAAASKQIIQVGYQQRSWPHFQEAAQIVKDGKLGKISMVLASWYQAYVRNRKNMPPLDEQKLDWKRFQGASQGQQLDIDRFRNWRWYWAFGGGHLTDLYSHYCDVIHWYLGSDTPKRAMATGSRGLFPQFDCPDTMNAGYDYPGDVTVVYNGSLGGSLDAGNILFRGTEGMLKINRDGYQLFPEGVIQAERTHYPEPSMKAVSPRDATVDHVANFIDCVRTRKKPNAPPEVAVPAARAAHLGNKAYRSGAPVSWPA